MRRLTIALGCAGLIAGLAPARAMAQDQFWLAAADDHLQDMRGGFAVAPGLVVSFGILRTVEVNGAVVASTSFHVGDLQGISAVQGQQLAQAAAAGIVQNGPGNALAANIQGGLPALVIQNTLNGQQIRTVTQIDAITNGLSLLKALNVSQTLNDALAAAVRR